MTIRECKEAIAGASTEEEKLAILERKLEEDAKQKKREWLINNGFDVDSEIAYVVTGDTYSIKDELKSAGFRYNGFLKKWLRSNSEGYEDKVIRVAAEELLEFSAWGDGHFFSDAKKLLDDKMAGTQSKDSSEWVGEIGKKIDSTLVTLDRKHNFLTRFGGSIAYTFRDQDGNIYSWMTTKDIHKDVEDQFFLTGTVKEHSTYNGVKQTRLIRCSITDR